MGSIDIKSVGASSPLCHIVTPTGMLGYGLNQDQVDQALEECVCTGAPTAIILDSGSTDGGPSVLALGTMTCPRSNYKRDLRKLLSSGHRFKAPVLISSAGGSGSDENVEEIVQMCEEIAEEPGNSAYNFTTIAIFAGISKALVTQRLAKGVITGCGPAVPPMTQADIDDCPRIVAQMGPEPFVEAMEAQPDFNLLIGGRAYDPSPFVAFATFCFRQLLPKNDKAFSSNILGSFMHMGKILECGGSCAKPKSSGAMATIYQDGTYDIRPLAPNSRCTPLSVAAHTLYEKSRPDILSGPGGYFDVTQTQYEQLGDNRTVRVRDDRFQTSAAQGVPYQVKLEAAKMVGFRSMYIGSMRDPILIRQIDEFLMMVKEYVRQQQSDAQGAWKLEFHKYGGKDAEELVLIGEALADTQALATAVADTARVATIHGAYAGQKATSGNFAFGICGTKNVELGPCTEFCIYHLMSLEPGEESAFERPGQADGHERNAVSDSRKGIFQWRTHKIGQGVPEATDRVAVRNDNKHDQHANSAKAVSTSRMPMPQPLLPLSGPLRVVDAASVLCSKNSGPYEITFDVMFDDPEIYRVVKESGVLNCTVIEGLCNLKPGEMIWCGWFDQALAFKATIPRKRAGQLVAAGGFLENDVHGSQQYIPLIGLTFSEKVAASLREIEATRG